MICKYLKNDIGIKQLVLSGTYGIESDELALDCVDLYSNHYYPMNTKQLQSDAANGKCFLFLF